MADAVYRSSYEPWSEYVSGIRGKDPGWDPLAFRCGGSPQARVRMLRVGEPYRYNRNWQSRTTPQDKAVEAHKGWLINQGTVDQADQQTSANEYQVFNPALPEVREYLLNVFREIYMNYRIDGMLFDDYFTPTTSRHHQGSTTPTSTLRIRAMPPTTEGLKQQMGDWRRANVNLLMHQPLRGDSGTPSDLRFGLSPAGIAYHGPENMPEELGLPSPVPGDFDRQYDRIYSDPPHGFTRVG